MGEWTRSSIDVESPEAFNASNPPPIDESLIGLLSNPPVPPFEVDHYRSSCCLSSFNQSIRAMLTLVFGIDHGREGVPSLVGPSVWFFICGRAQKVAPRGIPR